MLALEKQQQDLEAKLVKTTEELQAAAGHNVELAEQVHTLTKSVEEKHKFAVRESEQKLRHLQVSLQLHLIGALRAAHECVFSEHSLTLVMVNHPKHDG